MIFITSNRDEKLTRRGAIPPMIYKTDDFSLIYPTDAAAGGTWIVMKENGDAVVLLNGAFLPHRPIPPYRKSRGLVLLDIIKEPGVSQSLLKIDLERVEPFTLVLLEDSSLYEFRWDGKERYFRRLSVHRPHIWSSTTLYDGLVMKKREQWFAAFLSRTPNPTQQDILHFHRFAGDGDSENDLLMTRNDQYSTVSITSMLISADTGSMKHLDIAANNLTEKKIGFVRIGQEV
jgi:hypothetical protein